MRVAIISDIHDNLANLNKCLNWCEDNNIQAIFGCGDFTNSDTIKFLGENFQKPIFLVQGNCDFWEEKDLKNFANFNFLGRFGRFELADKKIGLCHEPIFIDKVLELGKCDIIFYGHTHRPFEENKNNTKLINPGTLGGVFQKATFATWDTESNNLELKILEFI